MALICSTAEDWKQEQQKMTTRKQAHTTAFVDVKKHRLINEIWLVLPFVVCLVVLCNCLSPKHPPGPHTHWVHCHCYSPSLLLPALLLPLLLQPIIVMAIALIVATSTAVCAITILMAYSMAHIAIPVMVAQMDGPKLYMVYARHKACCATSWEVGCCLDIWIHYPKPSSPHKHNDSHHHGWRPLKCL